MEYTFSFGALFFGMIVVVIGTLFFLYHQKIADTMGSGIASYDRYKLWALVAIGAGIVIMLNLHTLLTSLFINSFFRL